MFVRVKKFIHNRNDYFLQDSWNVLNSGECADLRKTGQTPHLGADGPALVSVEWENDRMSTAISTATKQHGTSSLVPYSRTLDQVPQKALWRVLLSKFFRDSKYLDLQRCHLAGSPYTTYRDLQPGHPP